MVLVIYCSAITGLNLWKRKWLIYYFFAYENLSSLVKRLLWSIQTSLSNLMTAESSCTTLSLTCQRFTCWLAWSISSRTRRTTKSKLQFNNLCCLTELFLGLKMVLSKQTSTCHLNPSSKMSEAQLTTSTCMEPWSRRHVRIFQDTSRKMGGYPKSCTTCRSLGPRHSSWLTVTGTTATRWWNISWTALMPHIKVSQVDETTWW